MVNCENCEILAHTSPPLVVRPAAWRSQAWVAGLKRRIYAWPALTPIGMGRHTWTGGDQRVRDRHIRPGVRHRDGEHLPANGELRAGRQARAGGCSIRGKGEAIDLAVAVGNP